MKKYRNFIYLLGLAFILFLPQKARAEENVSFVHLGLEEGLSQSTVLGITQDGQGYMWFATLGGLNRYDGHAFTVFRHDSYNASSISSDIVRTVMTDAFGRVWAGTLLGLSMYDREHENFVNYELVREDGSRAEVNEIACVNDSTFLLVTSFGLRMFRAGDTGIKNENPLSGLENQKVTSLLSVDGCIYFGTRYGSVFRWKPEENVIETLVHGNSDDAKVNVLFVDSLGRLWAGTEGDGLLCIDLQSGKTVKKYRAASGAFSSDYIRSLSEDAEGRLWVGTFVSLCSYDAQTDSFTEYSSDVLNENSISHSSVRAIYHDNQGGMWLGTYFGGVNYYHPLYRRFTSFRNVPYRNSLNDNVVNCFAFAGDDEIWIGTNSGGVNKLDSRGRFSYFTAADGLGANDVKALYVKGDRVYVGLHHGGFSIIDRRSGRLRNFLGKGSGMENGNVYAIQPYDDNTLLLGTVNGNIYSFDERSLHFKVLDNAQTGGEFRDGDLITLYKDSKNRIILGTENGVRAYTLGEKGLGLLPGVMPEELDGAFVNVIVETGDDAYLFGTRDGLYYQEDGGLRHFTVSDGLADNVVLGAVRDNEGIVWISTLNGLSRLDMSDFSFSNYGEADGLQSNEFCLYASAKAPDGRIYFGGVNGVSFFSPENLRASPFVPRPFISALYASERKIMPDDGSKILSRHISDTEALRLPSGESSFTLAYSVTDYISGGYNHFAYILEGCDEDWIYTTGRTVSYSRLAPGTYVFRVKAANKDGIWNGIPATLKITVVPVWYKTWWARMILVMVILLVFALGVWYLWARKSMEAQLEMERVDMARIREVNEMKLNFFVNMSHKLRTPLTLIIAPLKELAGQDNQDRWVSKRVKLAEKGADELLGMVNRLLEVKNDAELPEGIEDTATATDTAQAVSEQVIVKPVENKENILVVEDNDDIAAYLVDGLRTEYNVRRAANGGEALEMLQDYNAGLILSDVMMPVMDGIKLCRTMKQNIQTSHIPVIILSAKADLKWQMAGLKVGADDYIPKPFSMDMVRTKIRNIFRTRYSMLEHYAQNQKVAPEKIALSSMDEKFLKKAKQVVEAHLDNAEFTSENFAEEMNMSRANLHLKMKALTGGTTQDFVKKIKFGKACELIESGKYNIADIAVMVGYNSSSYFSTAFKKYVGVLPSDYLASKSNGQ